MKFIIIQMIVAIFIITTYGEEVENGVDVSASQGDVDWSKLKSNGYKFAVARVGNWRTQLEKYDLDNDIVEEDNLDKDFRKDPKFMYNIENIRENKLKGGAYHFFMGNYKGKDQAKKVIKLLKDSKFDKGKDMFAVVVSKAGNEEVTKKLMAKELWEFMKEIKDYMDDDNIYICTTQKYWDSSIDYNEHDFNDFKLWVRDYMDDHINGRAREPAVPYIWKDKHYTFWQYTDMGSANGINGMVNLSKSK